MTAIIVSLFILIETNKKDIISMLLWEGLNYYLIKSVSAEILYKSDGITLRVFR